MAITCGITVHYLIIGSELARRALFFDTVILCFKGGGANPREI